MKITNLRFFVLRLYICLNSMITVYISPNIHRDEESIFILNSSRFKDLLLFSPSVMSDSLRPYELQHKRLRLTFTISQSLLWLMSIEIMPSNHLILCSPLLLLPSILPNIRVFSNELALCFRWPKYWRFNFSISPSNEYLGLISFTLIFLQSRGLSRVFSSTTELWWINSSVLRFLYNPALTPILDYWKNHSFDYTDLCHHSDVSAF